MKNRVIEFWQKEVNYARNRLSRAERQYIEYQEAMWKHISNYGFVNSDLQKNCEDAFLNCGRLYLAYQKLVNKFLVIKSSLGNGNE